MMSEHKTKSITFYRRLILGLIDILSIFIAYIATCIFASETICLKSGIFLNTFLISIVVYIFLFYILKIYKSITKYAGARDYIIIGIGCFVSASIVVTISSLNFFAMYGPRKSILAAIITAVLCVSYRVLIRVILNSDVKKIFNSAIRKNILIIGGGQTTYQIIRHVLPRMDGNYKIIGIIDDNPNSIRCAIAGVEIIGNSKQIIKICEERNVDIILFAVDNTSQKDKNDLLKICNQTEAQIKVIPNMELIIKDEMTSFVPEFKDIEIEDLLGRDQIRLEEEEVEQFIKNKTVLVTGAGGSIGSELCRQITSFNPKKLVMIDIYENSLYDIELELTKKYPKIELHSIIANVREKKRLEEIFMHFRPEVVFHAAAHKHVPLMETSPQEAVKNNVFGTLNLSEVSIASGVKKFILVSTDKAVNPTSIMGATKRICEMIIQSKNSESSTDFVAVRFGNVLGSNGSVIPIFKKQIKEGGPVTVTHKDITRYFMTIPEAVGLILQTITFADGGEIFVLDMGEPVKIYDLAENMIRLAGHEPNIDIKIDVVGLRPGEKLYEELLVSEEGLLKTMNEKIMVSKLKDFNKEGLYEDLKLFREMVEGNDAADKPKLKKMIKKIVPRFVEDNDINIKKNNKNIKK